MKTKYSSILAVLFVLVLVASFIVPGRLFSPQPAAANPGMMEWTPVDTPDTSIRSINNIFSPILVVGEAGSEIVKLLVGRDGYTMYAIICQGVTDSTTTSRLRLYKSYNGGASWGGCYAELVRAVTGADLATVIVWDIAIAPDDANVIIAAVSVVSAITTHPVRIHLHQWWHHLG